MDASVTLAWAFEVEADKYSDSVLGVLINQDATVPGIWALGVSKVSAVGERRSRLSPADSARFVALLESLPIQLETIASGMEHMVSLARKAGLSTYDTAYLELAERWGLPLATRDTTLKKAANARGLLIF